MDGSGSQVVFVLIAVGIDEGDGGVAEALFDEVVGLGDGSHLVGVAFLFAHAHFGFNADLLSFDIEADNVGGAEFAFVVCEANLRFCIDSRFLQDAGEVRIE